MQRKLDDLMGAPGWAVGVSGAYGWDMEKGDGTKASNGADTEWAVNFDVMYTVQEGLAKVLCSSCITPIITTIFLTVIQLRLEAGRSCLTYLHQSMMLNSKSSCRCLSSKSSLDYWNQKNRLRAVFLLVCLFYLYITLRHKARSRFFLIQSNSLILKFLSLMAEFLCVTYFALSMPLCYFLQIKMRQKSSYGLSFISDRSRSHRETL
ncbi:hypothetical protein PCI56_12125 [Plesiomonas shigelloides subsp. oncorhynchi]|nr:hypothetical protein [Plesiomonas shigelloides]